MDSSDGIDTVFLILNPQRRTLDWGAQAWQSFASRRGLSKKLCEAWNWVQASGAVRDMVCRSLMLTLHPRLPVLPWVHVPHLASHLLARMTRQPSADWQRL